MTSDAQLAANRRNSKKSTGPKTAEGREVASRNALRHGLTARDLVVPEEEAADFMSFHDELRAALKPADPLEEQLVERIVVCSWRLRRVYRAEAGIAATTRRDWLGSSWNAGRPAPAGVAFIKAQSEMLALTRYERSVERSLHRALETLGKWQENRRLEAESDDEAGDYPTPRLIEPRPPDPRLWNLPGIRNDGLPSPHLSPVRPPLGGEEK